MKANELRIGNYITINDRDVPVAVAFIDSVYNKIGCVGFTERSIVDCHGIPLTEKWLDKSGFSMYENEYVQDSTNFELSRIDGVFKFHVEGNITGKSIQYVHQLQNLYFALTGEELEVKTIEV